MCGLTGYAAAAAKQRDPRLEASTDLLLHRGPDDRGVWSSDDGSVGLGHRRLAIVDLSRAGHQPMADAGGGTRIVFNGEIYNYRDLRAELIGLGHSFQSATDTEVVLEAYRAWGERCVERLNGMFAFVIHDAARRRLFLARDRAGEKPLFYAHRRGRIAFASELKALLDDPDAGRVLDPEAVDYYFAFGFVPADRCILQGVRKLPQGSALIYDIDEDRLREWRYWALPSPPPIGSDGSVEELSEELERLLEDSVRRRLVADVPVGVLLSGGIDSSLITAMAARAAGSVKTFTITFPGYAAEDEAEHARRVASHFGTDHHELPAQPAGNELLRELARQFDEPIADSSMLPTYLVSRLVRGSATVALGGDGGDELFGGYPHYSWLCRQAQARRWIPAPLRRGLALAAVSLPYGMRGRNHLIGFGDGLPSSVAHVNLYFDGAARSRLLRPLRERTAGSWQSPEAFKASLCGGLASPVDAATRVDYQTFLVDDILVKVDRASMLASLEVRAPFLDPRLIEFAFGKVPASLRATAGDRRMLIRRLAEKVLPPSFDTRRKQGFSLPLDTWFRGEWRDLLRSTLRDAPAELFDRDVISGLIRSHEAGRANAQRLFSLLLFELWRREYGIRLPE